MYCHLLCASVCYKNIEIWCFVHHLAPSFTLALYYQYPVMMVMMMPMCASMCALNGMSNAPPPPPHHSIAS